MMRRTLGSRGLLALVMLLPFIAHAVDLQEVAEGGRIYDKWWVEMDIAKPVTTHSAYPQSGKQKGAGTWRCKECHGWDYRGQEGAYSKGSHFSGIKGITAYAGGSEERVLQILKDKNHQYDSVMLDGALKTVARFVVHGQIDMSKYINAKTKQVKGNSKQGKIAYKEHCSSCHKKDGRNYNFSNKDGVYEYIGTIANDNPWEALHKIRNGHPGVSGKNGSMGGGMGMHGGGRMGGGRMHGLMLPMLAELNEQQQIDLLAYMQTLPTK